MVANFNGTVYVHSHKDSGKCYVGQTVKTTERRWRYHDQSYKNSRYFCHALKKYGWDAFDHQIVAHGIATQSELDNLERLWIALLRSNNPEYGYNSESGGSSGVMNEESRKKLSESQKRIGNRPPSALGRKRSEETKARMRVALKSAKSNTNRTSEHVEKIAAQLRGVKHSPERIAAYSGDNSGSAKLTSAQVIEIRKLKQELSLSNVELGLRFGVTDRNIGDIVRREIWKHV